MTDGTMLGQLIAQAEDEGAELTTLRAIAEEAGTAGATRALARLGLEDTGAAKDMAELRELLSAWRDAKKSMIKAVMQWLGRTVAALVLVLLAMRLGFPGWLK
ncbi:hypothetical protein SAMN03159338_3606 [Sphingomonas sp. NFR04]|uniref:DUF6127 family protein n=1 Tax=unclassified Sphingomonas TaxID=196159 RepID=UPI0008E03CCE|nr:DUF6127 family protein [Sphingomonas sp. NFR04]SFK22911.1 hypothetical protein SAMN03159338_3606 [Sphingomonas sp. NFR04]